jgi:hypothetical protein
VTDDPSEREAGMAAFYRIAEHKLAALQQQREVSEGIRNAGIG